MLRRRASYLSELRVPQLPQAGRAPDPRHQMCHRDGAALPLQMEDGPELLQRQVRQNGGLCVLATVGWAAESTSAKPKPKGSAKAGFKAGQTTHRWSRRKKRKAPKIPKQNTLRPVLISPVSDFQKRKQRGCIPLPRALNPPFPLLISIRIVYLYDINGMLLSSLASIPAPTKDCAREQKRCANAS